MHWHAARGYSLHPLGKCQRQIDRVVAHTISSSREVLSAVHDREREQQTVFKMTDKLDQDQGHVAHERICRLSYSKVRGTLDILDGCSDGDDTDSPASSEPISRGAKTMEYAKVAAKTPVTIGYPTLYW